MEAVLERKSVRGLHLAEDGTIIIDLSQPCSFRVRGLKVGEEWKEYLLRVSESGKLSLV